MEKKKTKFKEFIDKAAGYIPEIAGVGLKLYSGNITGAFDQARDIFTKHKDGDDPRVSSLAAEFFANQYEWYQAEVEAVQQAREHDIQTFDPNDRFSNRLRSSVRPVITYTAMAWYIYARVTGYGLTHEDFAIIGSVLAFWFGVRPFEKMKAMKK